MWGQLSSSSRRKRATITRIANSPFRARALPGRMHHSNFYRAFVEQWVAVSVLSLAGLDYTSMQSQRREIEGKIRPRQAKSTSERNGRGSYSKQFASLLAPVSGVLPVDGVRSFIHHRSRIAPVYFPSLADTLRRLSVTELLTQRVDVSLSFGEKVRGLKRRNGWVLSSEVGLRKYFFFAWECWGGLMSTDD